LRAFAIRVQRVLPPVRLRRRDGLRYESDTTDAEWFVMAPLLPPASPLGRPRATDMRTVINAILYIASTGCQWRQLPKDFPPFCNGPRLVNPFCVIRSPGSRFCTGSAHGRHLMGLEEDRSTNLRSRAHEATWWATA
jgi:hypothetical protein